MKTLKMMSGAGEIKKKISPDVGPPHLNTNGYTANVNVDGQGPNSEKTLIE